MGFIHGQGHDLGSTRSVVLEERCWPGERVSESETSTPSWRTDLYTLGFLMVHKTACFLQSLSVEPLAGSPLQVIGKNPSFKRRIRYPEWSNRMLLTRNGLALTTSYTTPP